MTGDKGYRNSKQFRKEIESGPLKEGVYLFLGEEEGEKDKCIQLMLERLLPGEEERRNASMIFNLEDPNEISAAAEYAVSPSMFSSVKVCVVRNVDKVPRGTPAELFREMIVSRAGGTSVIMTTVETRPPGSLGKDLLEGITVIQFWRMFDQDLRHYVTVSLRRNGMEIEEDALERLLDCTGRDIRKIDEALDMVRYSGESGAITVGVIGNFVHDVKSTTIFEFLDHFFYRDRAALVDLKKLLQEGTPDLLILSMIMKEAESLERYRDALRRGDDRDEAMKRAGVLAKNAERFGRRLKLFNEALTQALFRRIGDADREIKSGSRGRDFLGHPLVDLVSYVIIGA